MFEIICKACDLLDGTMLAKLERDPYANEAKFPTNWKIGKLILVYTSEQRTERGNDRPLTVLPIQSLRISTI